MLKTRIILGTVFSIVFSFLIGLDFYLKIDYATSFLLWICISIAFYEYITVVKINQGKKYIVYSALLIGLLLLHDWLALNNEALKSSEVLSLNLALGIIGFVGLLHSIKRRGLMGGMFFIFGIFYIWFTLRYVLYILHYVPIGGEPSFGLLMFLFLIVVSKTTDSAALFTGKFMGKHKLTKVSPNKTVEGAVGGAVFGIISGIICYKLTALSYILSLNDIIIYGFVVSFVSQIGDLVESFIKRKNKVKDSSSLFPEFGGILDIVDGLILSTPILYVILPDGFFYNLLKGN